MNSIKLFKLNDHVLDEIKYSTFDYEKDLQKLIEKNLNAVFGITFLASEYSTGREHSGRIDSLGIDENGCPVIIEYKRSRNANVINQGLFYLDWLMDHQADFKLLAKDKFDIVDIEWSSPRLLCIAEDFTRYDTHAVKQIDRNIDLVRYKKFNDSILLFELVFSSQGANNRGHIPDENLNVEDNYTTDEGVADNEGVAREANLQKTYKECLDNASEDLKNLHDQITNTIIGFGDDIQGKELKFYKAFRKITNFVCMVIRPRPNCILLYLKVDPELADLENELIRDVENVGHLGTGNIELTLYTSEDFKKILDLVEASYLLN